MPSRSRTHSFSWLAVLAIGSALLWLAMVAIGASLIGSPTVAEAPAAAATLGPGSDGNESSSDDRAAEP